MNENNFMKRVVGQQKLKKLFQRLIEREKFPHAILFNGPPGAGKEPSALELAKFFLCLKDNSPCLGCTSCHQFDLFQHPDFLFLFPIEKPKGDYTDCEWETGMNDAQLMNYQNEIERKIKDIYYPINFPHAQNILIDQVRHLIRKSSLNAYAGGNRFAIISPADKMTEEAQNSLLKLLEEPPLNFYLCLITTRPEALLPTVLSRCQPFYFPPLSKADIIQGLMEYYELSTDQAGIIAEKADGSFSQAQNFHRSGDSWREISIFKFLTSIVKNNPVEIFFTIKEIIPNNMQKKEAEMILLTVDRWISDIQRIDNGIKPRYNSDLMDRLEKFKRRIAHKDLNGIRRLILESVDLIQKNVYIDMIYLNLANRLARNLRFIGEK